MSMSREDIHIELTTRLRTMNRAIDRIAPDFPGEAVEEAIKITLEAVARGDMAEAVKVLEEVVQAKPFWLRGYLLLATVYQDAKKTEPAIAAVEKGLVMCTNDLRLFRARRWVETVERINGRGVHYRIRNHAERLRRYERIFRHRLAMLQMRRGCFNEAIEQWSAIEGEHCV